MFEVIIGLEVHAQLCTKTKLFCGCPNSFGAEPNTNVCPICLGLPGVLPVINKEALQMVIKTGLALNCQINEHSIFARKNYYYPDLPKNYQISQYELPLCSNGYLDLDINGEEKRIRIRRVHLEEDAGKLLHLDENKSAVDFNRTGVPLMEIVSEADINSPQEAVAYLTQLRIILQYLGVSTGNMEEGSLRAEPNISLRLKGEQKFGIKTELKNLNSFKAVYKGLEYEISRQKEILQEGKEIVQETRRWDEETQTTLPMRGKEEAHDYRYFPEPDLVPIEISSSWQEEIKKSLPELPKDKKKRFIEKLHLPSYDAEVLTSSKLLSDYYEECLKFYPKEKIVSNWVMNELLRLLNENNLEISQCRIKPEDFAQMLKMIDSQVISGKIAKAIFEEMFKTGNSPEMIVKEKGLQQISDEETILSVVQEVIKENPKVVAEFKGGKEKSLGFLVGQVMKKTKGRANPQLVNKILIEIIK